MIFAAEQNSRAPLLRTLEAYAMQCDHPEGIFGPLAQTFPGQAALAFKIADFVRATPACFERSHTKGHVTASAMVVTPDFSRVLLTFHAKLEKWLQLGGHSDGCAMTETVALTEATEESGLSDLALWCAGQSLGLTPMGHGENKTLSVFPYDVDVHSIPARGTEAAHLHYDVRFLVVAIGSLETTLSHESKDLRWVDADTLPLLTQEESMLRQMHKVALLRERV